MKPTPYDYASVLASFFETAGELPEHAHHLKPLVESAAKRALSHPDAAFMPAFKVLDLLSAMVTASVSIAREPHLRPSESKAMLTQLITDESPLLAHFYREAALERVRYEPVMLLEQHSTALEKRNAVLRVRFKRMAEIYTNAKLLNAETLHITEGAAEAALKSPDFITFRAGPMCQLFAEMLQHASTTSNLTELEQTLSPAGIIWRRFRLKSHRFSAHEDDPLITGESPNRLESPIPITHHLH